MKKVIFTLIICSFVYNLVNAQKTIEIDFNKKTTQTVNVNDIKRGEYYQIKIKNINLNLFKVSLTSIDTVLSRPQQTPTFGDFNLDALLKVIAGISPLSTSITQSLPSQALSQLYEQLIKNNNWEISDDSVNVSIKYRMEQESIALVQEKEPVEQLVVRIDNLKLEVYKLRLNSFKLANPSNTFNFDQALTDIEKIRKAILDLKTNITTKKTAYEAFSTTNKAAIAANTVLIANDKSIKETYDKFLSTLSDVLTSISADKANELLSTIVFIENNATNLYTSLPIQFTGEQAKVQISIVPRDEKYNLQSYYSQIMFPEKIKNYSVVGISFYTSSLYDKAYSTIKTTINDSTSNFNFREENVSKAELGIATLLRYGAKWNEKNDLGGHLSIGAGLSISNRIKPRFLFGGGLSLGEKHMLAIDCGGIAGYVDRLSSAIELSNTYSEKPENITVSKLGIGAFVSIGYIYQF